MTIYLITVPIYQSKAEEIGSALIENIITKYFILDCIIRNQESVSMSSLMNYLFSKLDIKLKTVASYNNQLLPSEHGIKFLSNILTEYLTNLGQMWPKYLPLARFAYNTFNTPHLANFSPYELVLGRKPKILLNLETKPDIKLAGISKRLAMINKDRAFFQYNSRDLVYIISTDESIAYSFKKSND